jgi:hypothetical protein
MTGTSPPYAAAVRPLDRETLLGTLSRASPLVPGSRTDEAALARTG